METPGDLKYSKEHEWVAVEGATATIGITDFAQDELGDIVYVELPQAEDKISREDAFGVIESVKAVSDIYAPISGRILEVNDSLPDSPEMLNEDPYGDGWIVKVEISDPEELDQLLSAADYKKYIVEENS